MEMPDHKDEIRERFIRLGRELVKDCGAEIILPLGYSIVPLTQDASDLAGDIGFPVLDPLPPTMHIAEALAASGFKNSRAAYPAADLP